MSTARGSGGVPRETGSGDVPRETYRSAGVDLEAAEEAVDRIRSLVASTARPEVVGGIGGFGGVFAFDPGRYEKPLLVSTTDGVGTKSEVARLTGRYDTIGLDCVAMSVDDLAVCGAEPLFFLDYISVGRNDPALIEAIVSGVAAGCRQAGCALVGGEISEHSGLMEPGHFDLVGFAVGVVEADRRLPFGVRAGDRVVGIASPGLRSNGYSLARKILVEPGDRRLDDPAWPGADVTLADELIRPSVIYSPALRRLSDEVEVHAFAHVTGGGIPGNLSRVLPDGLGAEVRRGAWPEPRIFSVVADAGGVADEEMVRVFNLGLGMLAVVPAGDVAAALASLAGAGHDAWEVGAVRDGDGVAVVRR
ncbi:MAG: phosphoribosylformylglycinamidine cyclo-ligase [Actinomycetota bacterium]|nr:phosphoribosylformylglycinamidine cyclo-ligase [Actinomycetota bacterium]